MGTYLINNFKSNSQILNHFMSIGKISIQINSILFVLCLIIFVFSLRHDLEHIKKSLETQLDIEYFLNVDEKVILISE